MTELLIFWTAAILVATVLATLRDVYDDGLGRREPPASHHPGPFELGGRPGGR
jgi:hypothetical protein